MIRTSRLALALALVLALGASTIAYAGAEGNVSTVTGKTKKKLDKKKFKPVKLFTQVATEFADPLGTQENSEQVYIDFGKNIKFKLGKADTCSADISGLDTDGARAACPPGSLIGEGEADARIPTGAPPPNDELTPSLIVSVFNGPGTNQLRLHAYTSELPLTGGGANPSVTLGSIVKSPEPGYGKRLSVPDAPDVAGDAGALTLFNATISKKSKTVRARCKQKKHKWHTLWVYDNGEEDEDTFKQKCKRKKKRS